MMTQDEIKIKKRFFFLTILGIFLLGFFGGVLGGVFSDNFFTSFKEIPFTFKTKGEIFPERKNDSQANYTPLTSQEEAVISVFKQVSPSVVSIIVSKDLPIFEEYFLNPFEGFDFPFPDPFKFFIPQRRQKGTEKREIGGGTGFIVSSDGLIFTNRHVVNDEKAEYTVLTNDGKKFPAKVLARDPVQDIALLKIENVQNLTPVKLGDSDKLEIGQTVIAIGNVLGEFRNSVSVGVISGLGRTITATGGGTVEVLEDVIQTDAAINRGNSGGPLLNLKGEVIGINTAMVSGAQNVGFAIPINKAKKSIEQVQKFGKIVYPFLGVRYVLINDKIQKENNLPVNYGAWIVSDNQNPAITPGSAAQKAGLKERDIILELSGEKITSENSLAKILMKYNPGDKVTLKILREGKEMTLEAVLGERTE
jgi:serine protease Do